MVWYRQCPEYSEQKDHLLNELLNERVSKVFIEKTLATPGLVNRVASRGRSVTVGVSDRWKVTRDM